MQVGGKKKQLKPTQPQFVVQLSPNLNSFAKLVYIDNEVNVEWVGDPNAATKFDSKYQAKSRIRDLMVIPDDRCFKESV